jgi:hypothetical protein
MKPSKKDPQKKRYKRIMFWKPWRDGGSKQIIRKGIVGSCHDQIEKNQLSN